MKNVILIIIAMTGASMAFSQVPYTVSYENWSNPTTYQLSPFPLITGTGHYSDSLSSVFNGKTFYENNGEYYIIESWADYYYWFTKTYSYKFNDPQLYEYYYLTNDNFGMASYIAGNYYKESFYPSRIRIDFGKISIKVNKLNDYTYIASNDKEKDVLINTLKQDPEFNELSSNNEIKTNSNNTTVIRKENINRENFIIRYNNSQNSSTKSGSVDKNFGSKTDNSRTNSNSGTTSQK